jgi:hypothetical protein
MFFTKSWGRISFSLPVFFEPHAHTTHIHTVKYSILQEYRNGTQKMFFICEINKAIVKKYLSLDFPQNP